MQKKVKTISFQRQNIYIGFLKGFITAQIQTTTSDISPTSGAICFITFLLFILSAIGWISGKYNWLYFAIPSILTSSILIIFNWSSAKDVPAFIWTVNMNMAPLIKIKGRDKFVNGKGEMLIKINSLINVVNEKGERMDEGIIQRYLGELVWYPSLAFSPYISWETIDEFSAKATMNYKGTSGKGTFHFDKKGDFIKFIALCFKGNEADAKRYPWVLTVDDYAVFEGIRVPSKMKATWILDEGD